MISQRANPVVVGLLTVGAVLLVAGGVLLWRVLPKANQAFGGTTGEYTPPANLPSALPASDLAGVRFAIVHEIENIQVTAPGYLGREIARWGDLLEEAGARVAPAGEADVLILPHAECLGLESRQLIAQHLQAGRGLVTTGPLGALDGECRPLRDTLLVQLLGGSANGPPFVRTQETFAHLVVLGETVLAADVPPGARFELSPAVSHLVFRDPTRGIFFADFARNPIQQDGIPFFDAAVARAQVARGRVVAFGFGVTEVDDPWSRSIVRLIAANAVRWAAGWPVAQLAVWPAGAPAAALIAQDVEADFANAARAVDLIERYDVPTTWFVVGQLAKAHRGITRRMANTGEIASHSYHHRPMDTFSDAGQREELALARSETQSLTGHPVAGFRPPEERFTLETLRHWADLGGEYVFVSNNARTASPDMIPIGGDTLVLLDRVVTDDFEILSRAGMRDRGKMVEALVHDLDRVLAYRGLYSFSYHSHLFAKEELISVLEALLQALQERPEIWVSTGQEIADWWRARAGTRTEVARDGSSATVQNGSRLPLEEAVLLVDLPTGERRRVPVPALGPGESVVIPLVNASTS